MKITEIRKFAKELKINVKSTNGENRTKESLIRSINKKMMKGGNPVETIDSLKQQIKDKLKHIISLFSIANSITNNSKENIKKNIGELYDLLSKIGEQYPNITNINDILNDDMKQNTKELQKQMEKYKIYLDP